APLAAIEQAGNAPQADIYWLHTDLNSAPLEVTDADGNLRWSGQYDTFGKLRGQTPGSAGLRTGAAYAQPLRFAGQYQDNESGLHYNLFRYYEPEVGRFTTQDPIGLAGGWNLYQYAPNVLGWVDPLGLTAVDAPGYHVYGLFDPGATQPYYIGITNDIERRTIEHLGTGRLSPGASMRPIETNVNYGQARGYEQFYIEEYKTKTGIIGDEISSKNRGNKYNSFDHSRTDARAKAFKDTYDSKKFGSGLKGKRGC
ncbi:sugar-binding protein, partial [Mangrovibacter sp. MFB070]|uniref:RHS repeat-associated core domain-containing protein n=1 Tax=Mangrovibacter sp. MFB070 TaxID=1224318 RepID=UPI0004D82578